MNKSLTFFIPGKTFLIGEYVALLGGPNLIFCQKPYFKATVFDKAKNPNKKCILHPESPAGLYLRKHQLPFGLIMDNPFSPPGGLGASTAEFLAIYLAHLDKNNNELQIESLKKDYLALFENHKPSGADLVAQSQKGLVIQQKNKPPQSLTTWPFENLGLFLIHTQKKLATHLHLKALNLQKDFNRLAKISQKTIDAVLEKDESTFINSINAAATELAHLELVASHSKDILNLLNKEPAILAAKGCGAMGADVIALFYEQNKKGAILDFFKSHQITPIADEQSLAY